MNKLDEEGLKRLGWYLAKEKSPVGTNVWRLKVPYYHHEFQMVIGNYPNTNPNCGVLSLYQPKEQIPSFTNSDKPRKIMITMPEQCIPIAHHVNSYERLHIIIQSLTQVNLW